LNFENHNRTYLKLSCKGKPERKGAEGGGLAEINSPPGLVPRANH